ncbi:MAG: hypothetical protein Q8K92_12810 [Leadbetterella sp.]|nr:hypothetical protein [Leadbetterella sp.]
MKGILNQEYIDSLRAVFYLKIYTFFALSNKEPSWPLPMTFLYKPPMRFMTMRR